MKHWPEWAKLSVREYPVMPSHYFHCTDGIDLDLDRHGREAEADSDVLLFASVQARTLKERRPDIDDWSQWLVSIHDRDGFLVSTYTFAEIECALSVARRLVYRRGPTPSQGSVRSTATKQGKMREFTSLEGRSF